VRSEEPVLLVDLDFDVVPVLDEFLEEPRWDAGYSVEVTV
jgi:hypothetical protein